MSTSSLQVVVSGRVNGKLADLSSAKTTRQVIDAMPEGWKNYLIQSGDDVDNAAWKWGDMSKNLIYKMGCPRMLADKSVAELTKKSSSSIRFWRYCAQEFPDAIREQYGGILSIEHFKAAYQYKTADGGNPLVLLEYAAQVSEDRDGKAASVDECLYHFGLIENDIEITDEEQEERRTTDHPNLPVAAYAFPVYRRISKVRSRKRRERLTRELKSLLYKIDHDVVK